MDIGIIGSLGPSEGTFSDLASAVGHDVYFHDRVVDGGRQENLARFIDGCSIVVIVLDVTPVAIARLASEHMRRRMRSPLLLRRSDLGRFTALMAVLVGHPDRDLDEESQPRLRTGTGTR
jgi:hypothetical protein